MDNLTVRLALVTFDRAEQAAHLIGWEIDEVLKGLLDTQKAQLSSRSDGLRFLSICLIDGAALDAIEDLDSNDVEELAATVAVLFFDKVIDAVIDAGRRLDYYVDAAGVAGMSGGGTGTIGLALAGLPMDEESHARGLPLADCLFRLALRGIKHLSDTM